MKRLIVIAAFMIFAALPASSQTVDCPADKVCLNQETANKLFNTVEQLIAAKDVIAKMLAERGASDSAIASAMKVIEGYKDLESINGQMVAKYQQVIKLYEQTIEMYQRLVETLEKRLSKPKSAFSKVMSALKTIGYILAGAALGRGL